MGTQAQGPGTEAFARRLREIREASGRSYGALARRVGVSGSTLHRYCSGHTVPMEFGPVERFARLCGCQGDELVALHRLWLAADTERTLRQEAAGTLPKPTPGAPGAPEAPDVPNTPGAPEAQDAPGAPEAGPGPVAAGGVPGAGAAVPGRSGAEAPGAESAGRPDVVAAPVVAAPEVTVVLGAPSRRARIGRLLPRPVAVAALVTAVAVLIGLLVFDGLPFLGSEREPTARLVPDGKGVIASGSPDSRPAPRRSPTGSPSATGSLPPVPSATGGAPRTAATRGATGPAKGPARSGRPSAQASGRAPAAGPPFAVRTDQHAWKAGCDHTYLVDRAPGAVPPPPMAADARPWADALGAVHGGETLVRFTVQGLSEEAVVLQALRVRIVARRDPLPRNAFRMDSGCGGSITERTFAVDLDRPRPVVRPVPGGDENGTIPAVAFPYRVSAKDPETFLATASTAGCDCDWYLELEWSSGDRSGTARIDAGGRPFRTSGSRGRPTYLYEYGERRWIPSGRTGESALREPVPAATPSA
ncbi:helix-turn-helix domain-containing protein [Streptomyces sp. NPDC000594]|uniref:transcriptional regulator n=1 Tax=Streptomyces sp. NPDC000594 TaxID=3154261 RepID=UPI003321509C